MTHAIVEADVVRYLRGNQWLVQNGHIPKAHAVLCDPPYGLEFMGKEWDKPKPSAARFAARTDEAKNRREKLPEKYVAGEDFQAWVTEWATLLLDYVYPGALLMAFGGTRTYHRLAAGLEDAGWEISDGMQWCFGSGFPKSLDISKSIDREEGNYWRDINKAVDNLSVNGIIDAWEKHSNHVKFAGVSFQKSVTEIGPSTLKSGSALLSVRRPASLAKSLFDACIAELKCSDPLVMLERTSTVPSSASQTTIQSNAPAKSAESSFAKASQTLDTLTFTALYDAKVSLNESTADKLRADEALRIWIGSDKSSKQADTSALCVALTDDLKLTILSQSRTFQNLDTKSQTDFVSATTVTITASTAESLISSTVATLKRKALDREAGATREVVGDNPNHRAVSGVGYEGVYAGGNTGAATVTAPATPLAARWQGYGTALKPGWESVVVCRAPRGNRTYAGLAREFGTGALAIDAGRIPAQGRPLIERDAHLPSNGIYGEGLFGARSIGTTDTGRWPANFALVCTCEGDDHADDCPVKVLGEQSGETGNGYRANQSTQSGSAFHNNNGAGVRGHADTGTAARFFYQAKASAWEREAGLHDRMRRNVNDGRNTPIDNPFQRGEMKRLNVHPTVKPIRLAEYLARLILPPVLDEPRRLLIPFAGSGSEMVGALLAGWDVVTGIERETEYVELARARVGWWAQFSTYDEARAAYEKGRKAQPVAVVADRPADKPQQASLFDEEGI